MAIPLLQPHFASVEGIPVTEIERAGRPS